MSASSPTRAYPQHAGTDVGRYSPLFPVLHASNEAALRRVQLHTQKLEHQFRPAARQKLIAARIAANDEEADRVIELTTQLVASETPITMWFPASRTVPMPPPRTDTANQTVAMTHDVAMRNLFELGGTVLGARRSRHAAGGKRPSSTARTMSTGRPTVRAPSTVC